MNGNENTLRRNSSAKTAAHKALLVLSLALMTGCGGGGATFQTSSNKTLGQELQDLQESYDKGIITKKEFDQTKKDLMKSYTKH